MGEMTVPSLGGVMKVMDLYMNRVLFSLAIIHLGSNLFSLAIIHWLLFIWDPIYSYWWCDER